MEHEPPPSPEEFQAAVARQPVLFAEYSRVAAQLRELGDASADEWRALAREARELTQRWKACSETILAGARAHGATNGIEELEAMFAATRREMAGNPFWEPGDKN